MNNEIVTLVTFIGEIVGRVKSINDAKITLDNPRIFMQTEQGAGFAPGICATGENHLSSAVFDRSCVLTVVKTEKQAADAWVQVTSGIVV